MHWSCNFWDGRTPQDRKVAASHGAEANAPRVAAPHLAVATHGAAAAYDVVGHWAAADAVAGGCGAAAVRVNHYGYGGKRSEIYGELDALTRTAQLIRATGGPHQLRCNMAGPVLFGRCLCGSKSQYIN